MLLPRIVELRTDCASTATLLQASRRNNRRSELERFALELTSMYDIVCPTLILCGH